MLSAASLCKRCIADTVTVTTISTAAAAALVVNASHLKSVQSLSANILTILAVLHFRLNPRIDTVSDVEHIRVHCLTGESYICRGIL